MNEISKILDDFIKVCELSRIKLLKEQIKIEVLLAGQNHIQKPLPKGNMAVYIFLNKKEDMCYKVGKVGVNSNARFQSQHYNSESSRSNLAKSILKDNTFDNDIDAQNKVGMWIKENTTRINLYLKGDIDILTLTLLEVFIQNRLKPKYEGFCSQS